MPNNVTFKIIESRAGESVLYLHNHGQKLVSEQHRSKDIDEIVKVLKGKMNYRSGFNNALLNEMQVFDYMNQMEETCPEA